jgi:hypothetical protein
VEIAAGYLGFTLLTGRGVSEQQPSRVS